ncbi:MAG: ion transporter [Ghiorsea sp.]
MSEDKLNLPAQAFLNRCFFDLSTTLGRTINLMFMILVIGSVIISMIGTLKSVPSDIRVRIESFEIFITYVFALEYILRIYSARWRKKYALSFNGLIDLLTWAPLLIFGVMSMPIRLLRVLRLLKLLRYMRSLTALFSSMSDIANLIFVVVSSIAIIVIVFGNAMFLIEPETFPNAFIGSWWSLITMTTVGYGDIIPQTALGKGLAIVLILIGISMFALLTGTISARLSEHLQYRHRCRHCELTIPAQSYYCPHCGTKKPLSDEQTPSEHIHKNYSPLEEKDDK